MNVCGYHLVSRASVWSVSRLDLPFTFSLRDSITMMAMAREFHRRTATDYGPVAKCPAWMVGVTVTRGPHFEWSGFHRQGQGVYRGMPVHYVGQTVSWDADTIAWIVEEIFEDLRGNGDGRGSWWPHRSIPVDWPHVADGPALYKAGDERLWDIGFWPLSLGLRTEDDFNRFLFPRQRQLREALVRAESSLRLSALLAASQMADIGRRDALIDQVEHFLHGEAVDALRVITLADNEL